MNDQTNVNKWVNIGFLKDIEENKKEELANCYEDAINFLKKSQLIEDTYVSVETYIFPVIYKLAKTSGLILEPIKLIRELTDFLKRPQIMEMLDREVSQFDDEAEALNIFVQEVKEKNQL